MQAQKFHVRRNVSISTARQNTNKKVPPDTA